METSPDQAGREDTTPRQRSRRGLRAAWPRAVGSMADPDERMAVRSAAAMNGALALGLGVVALADARAWPLAVGLLAAGAALVAAGLLLLARAGRPTLGLALAGDLAALGIVAGAIAASGASRSGYHALHLLPVAHAAAFQPTSRLVLAGLAGSALLLAPVGYEPASGRFAVLAGVGLAAGLAAIWLLHSAVRALRAERRHAALREADAMRIAESDPLTGVGNYRMFRRSLEKESARARRHGLPFSLIVLDLDGFKAINDELGHQAGDEALRQVAEALRGALRTEDVLCRQGGDEFGVIAVQAGHGEAGELARRLRAAVGAIHLPGLRHPLSVSAGWATFAHPVSDADALLARADRELMAAKRRRATVGRPPPEPVVQRPAAGPLERDLDPRLATLSDCARSLALASDEREVVHLAVTHLVEALDASVAEVWRRPRLSGQPLLAARARQATPGRGRPFGAAVDPVVVQEVMASNRLLVAPVAGEPLDPGATPTGSVDLLVPVTRAGEVLGALRVRLDRPDAGSPRDRQLALALAAQVGVALAAAAARASLADGHPEEAARQAGAVSGLRAAERVAQLSIDTARMLGLAGEELESLRLAALLHRLGLVGVPAGLLVRPFALSEPEREVLQQHPVIAEELLVPLPDLRDAAAVLRHAYERHDGRGYPDGLAGDRIPLASRVLHAAIAFVAMTSDRPYRPAMDPLEARGELRRAAEDGQLDPVVAEVMLAVIDTKPPGWLRTPAQRSPAAG